jgi:hypothetical protein
MADGTRTDPRYHAAYQRGYSGPAPERLDREQELFRRPRRAGGRSQRPVAEPVAPEARPALPSQESSFAALSSVPDETPTLLADTPAEAGAEHDAGAQQDAASAAATFDTRRVSLTLAAIGGVLVVVGLLALWRSAQSWYSSSPIQDTFGVEQYLRELTNNLMGPCLTVGLLALCFSVLVPLVRAVRR